MIKKIIRFAIADQDPDDPSLADLAKVSFEGFIDPISMTCLSVMEGNDFSAANP